MIPSLEYAGKSNFETKFNLEFKIEARYKILGQESEEDKGET